MVLDPIPDAVIRHYQEDYAERDRLDSPHGTVEYQRTCELLDRHLPDAPAHVLDVGGGPGQYASWMVERGYEVTLVDPVERHVADADTIDGVTAEVGDARQLSLDDGVADATLLLGPLYHLVRRHDRLQALSEARRVTRSGGLVVVAAISRYAAMIDYAARGSLPDSGPVFDTVAGILEEGRFTGSTLGFTEAYFHRPQDLVDELAEAGLADVGLYGVEGPAVAALWAGSVGEREARIPAVLTAARLAEADREVIAASHHLLAVGSVRPGCMGG